MARNKKRGDIDADYTAIRLRMTALTASAPPASNVVPPHGHAAANITFQETQSDGSGRLASDDVQEALEELDSEKLARSGEQPMLGNLDMNHWSINNVSNLEVEQDINMTGGVGSAKISGTREINFEPTAPAGEAKVNFIREINFEINAVGEANINTVRNINFEGGVVGEGQINFPRVIHMVGDDSDAEARIDGLERVIFNDEVTKSVIENPSVIQFNTAVLPGNDTAYLPGQIGWSDLDKTLVSDLDTAGTQQVRLALGWTVFRCVDGREEGGE